MSTLLDHNNPDIKEGEQIYGYFVRQVVKLKEICAFLYLLENTATGARHMKVAPKTVS